jgi:dienelactone hydrolase
VDGVSPTPDRVISVGLRLVGLAPSGRTEPTISSGVPTSLSVMTQRSDVEFLSSGVTLRGWLYEAVGQSSPGVVMAHGLSAVKEMFLDDYAAAFAEAGFTTLVYDHFGFGASDGEPRQSQSPHRQQQGYRDAISRLTAVPGVDPAKIGIWGTSFSGGHVLTLCAEDLPICAGVAQVPFLAEGGPEPSAALLEAIGERAADPMATVPATTDVDGGVGVMYLDGSHAWFTGTAEKRAPAWRNELLVAGILEAADWRPFDDMARTKVPLLVIAAPGDTLTPPGPLLAMEPKPHNVEVVEISGNHFDAYEAGFEASSGAAIVFFQRHLGG